MAATADAPPHDVVVLSDLHLGRGRNPETGRYFSLETFFWDDDLRSFCRYLRDDAAERGVPLKVIFNGDVFDLLRIEPEEAGPGASARERRYGPALDAPAAARRVAEILAGHPEFVDGVALLLEAGIEVIFLPGNHDVELQWEPVQAEVRRALVEVVRARGGDEAAAGSRLRFEPWFHYEPGRLWIEHGCQYDPESSFRFPLRGALAASPTAADDAEDDLPLGNFFQRYLYNAFGPITFIVPSTRANFRYMKWMLINQPALVARVVASQAPFVLQLLRRLAKAKAAGRHALGRVHEEELSRLATTSGLGEKLRSIDSLKQVRHDMVQALRALGWQTVKVTTAALLIAFLGAGLWFAGFNSIYHLRLGFGLKTLLFLGLNFAFLMAAALAGGFALFRGAPPLSPTPLWRAAREIAGLLEVPIVGFGHTHDEALWRIDGAFGRPAWYFNTGTWIAVFAHDELMPRERVQFTFLRVRGMDGELLQWSPGRGRPQPVILLDEETRWAPVRAGGAPAA